MQLLKLCDQLTGGGRHDHPENFCQHIVELRDCRTKHSRLLRLRRAHLTVKQISRITGIGATSVTKATAGWNEAA